MASTGVKTAEPITTLKEFSLLLSAAVTANRNSRLNNMAMLRALNAKSMPEILNQAHMHEATIAYHGVLRVLIRAKLGIHEPNEDELVLTYDRFQSTLSEVKRYLLIINS